MPFNLAPRIRIGRRPGSPIQSMSAPMARNGSTTLPIGRRESDASPLRTTPADPTGSHPANRPVKRRAVVPLLPQSMVTSSVGVEEGGEIFRIPDSKETSAPRACTASRLARVSSQSSHPAARQGPEAIKPKRAARWETDLSPGTATFPARGSYARDSSRDRITPPGRRFTPVCRGRRCERAGCPSLLYLSGPCGKIHPAGQPKL